MSNTVNNSIPFVPENTIDPAAGLNESLLTVDALLQLAVVSVGDNTPPGSPANGARYVVGTAPTGAWAAGAGAVAQFLDGAWRFYAARYVLNMADGLMYVRQGATWGVAAAEWTAETVSQAEAEAGTATTRRAWTAERVRQAILGWWHEVGEWVDLRPYLIPPFFWKSARDGNNHFPQIRLVDRNTVELRGVVSFNATSAAPPTDAVAFRVPEGFRPQMTSGGLCLADSTSPLWFGQTAYLIQGQVNYSSDPGWANGNVQLLLIGAPNPVTDGAVDLIGIRYYLS